MRFFVCGVFWYYILVLCYIFIYCDLGGKTIRNIILSLVFLFSIINAQDKLITLSGAEYQGKYIGNKGDKVEFVQSGKTSSIFVPKSSVKTVMLSSGEKVDFSSTDISVQVPQPAQVPNNRIIEIQEIARENARKFTNFDWLLIGIRSGVTSTISGISMMFLLTQHISQLPSFFVGGILGFALPVTTVYFEKKKDSENIHLPIIYQYSDLINTEEEQIAYQDAYNNELKRELKRNLLKIGTYCSASILAIFIGFIYSQFGYI